MEDSLEFGSNLSVRMNLHAAESVCHATHRKLLSRFQDLDRPLMISARVQALHV